MAVGKSDAFDKVLARRQSVWHGLLSCPTDHPVLLIKLQAQGDNALCAAKALQDRAARRWYDYKDTLAAAIKARQVPAGRPPAGAAAYCVPGRMLQVKSMFAPQRCILRPCRPENHDSVALFVGCSPEKSGFFADAYVYSSERRPAAAGMTACVGVRPSVFALSMRSCGDGTPLVMPGPDAFSVSHHVVWAARLIHWCMGKQMPPPQLPGASIPHTKYHVIWHSAWHDSACTCQCGFLTSLLSTSAKAPEVVPLLRRSKATLLSHAVRCSSWTRRRTALNSSGCIHQV